MPDIDLTGICSCCDCCQPTDSFYPCCCAFGSIYVTYKSFTVNGTGYGDLTVSLAWQDPNKCFWELTNQSYGGYNNVNFVVTWSDGWTVEAGIGNGVDYTVSNPTQLSCCPFLLTSDSATNSGTFSCTGVTVSH